MAIGIEKHLRRAEKVRAWIKVIEEAARDLELEVLSRHSETASETGTDPEPRLRPCEHRPEWRRGRLCLACDNTNLRTATEQERAEGLSYDPYLIDPPRDNYAVKRDQSDSSRRARDIAQLDASIESLERAARLRDGQDVSEGDTRSLRVMETARRTLGRDGLKVLAVLVKIRDASPGAYRAVLDGHPRALDLVAQAVPGKLRMPA